MKIHFLFPINRSPAGGGHQFLSILKRRFLENGHWADTISESEIVLFNSHQRADGVAVLKNRYPDKIFIHRVDGPMRIYNSWSDKRDYLVKALSNKVADGTIFQSNWSRRENHRLGLPRNVFETVIYNAVDPAIFNPLNKSPYDPSKKIRLITSCWSTNPGKGFDVYHWLDENLDWSQYEMTLVGNSPLTFKNIRHIKPVPIKILAEILKRHDIYIFASKHEACSNALLEAMHCGLPVVACDSSSNPELVGGGGELYDRKEDIPDLIKKISRDYGAYKKRIQVMSIEYTARKYLDFMQAIYQRVETGSYVPKRINLGRLSFLLVRLSGWRINGRLNNRLKRLSGAT
jgi:glycosyltransferase involved in cell wall biosynthesis